jgi:hypothetical protein
VANCKYFLISGYQNFYFLMKSMVDFLIVYSYYGRESLENVTVPLSPQRMRLKTLLRPSKSHLIKVTFFPTILTLCFYLFSILELCSVTCFFPNCQCIPSLVSVFQISANIFL